MEEPGYGVDGTEIDGDDSSMHDGAEDEWLSVQDEAEDVFHPQV